MNPPFVPRAVFLLTLTACTSGSEQPCPGTIYPPAYYGANCLVIIPIGRDAAVPDVASQEDASAEAAVDAVSDDASSDFETFSDAGNEALDAEASADEPEPD